MSLVIRRFRRDVAKRISKVLAVLRRTSLLLFLNTLKK
nr:MAG TPA: hypothetical protein [Caudoviricetes sp.]